MEDMDIAWAAGFFDGEGYVGIARRRNKWTRKRDNTVQQYDYYTLVAKVGQVVEEPLLKLQQLFGGTITKTPRNLLKPKWHQIRTWELQGETAENFLVSIRPYLVVKAQQADIALEYRLTVGKGKINVEEVERFRTSLMAIKLAEKDAANG